LREHIKFAKNKQGYTREAQIFT